MREYTVNFRHLGFAYEVAALYDTSGPAGCYIEIQEILRDGKFVAGDDFDGLNNNIDPKWTEKAERTLFEASCEGDD